ncbi:MAG: hypothetical protein K2O73_07620, partial [Lachnospiraceae bacterium]|nr:hypothetical protein [Lachnospiraceae bacterium]
SCNRADRKVRTGCRKYLQESQGFRKREQKLTKYLAAAFKAAAFFVNKVVQIFFPPTGIGKKNTAPVLKLSLKNRKGAKK